MSNSNISLVSRPSALLLAAVLAVGLAGCKSDGMDDAFVPYSIDDRYPVASAKAPVTMEVPVHGAHLGPRQARAVSGFARQAASAGVSPVVIAAPSGGGASKHVAQQIAAIMNENGIPRERLRMSSYRGPAGGAVQISLMQGVGASRECGVWDEDLTETSSNRPYTNHGCAVRSNIAAMVADPQDLTVPKPVDPAPAVSRPGVPADNSAGSSSSSLFSFF